MYDFETQRVADEIQMRKCGVVLLQFAEGLKTYAVDVQKQLEASVDASFIISTDPCYGGCDLADREARGLGAELLVHYGHTPYMAETAIPTIYVKAKSSLDPLPLLEKSREQLAKAAPLGLASTTQHIHSLPAISEWLRSHGIEVKVGDPCAKAILPGQVLGCDYTSPLAISKDVKSILFIGGGDFHALGLALSTGKQVLLLDPYRQELRGIEQLLDKTLKLRWASIVQARSAEKFGIIICSKPGQQNLPQALRIKRLLEEKGKSGFLIVAREITSNALLPFPADAYVITGCPRLPIDDAATFRQPILTAQELFISMEKPSEPFPYKLIPPDTAPLPGKAIAAQD